MTLSSVIGFVPAILILYILLRRYEGFFKEKYIFLSFAVGLILGMIITVFHLVSDDFILSHLDLSLLVFVLLFALFEEAAKLVILNMPRLQLKYDTVYYGAGLGLGVGSMAIVAISFKVFMDDPNAFGNLLTITGLVVLSFNFSLLHSATGVMIGYGCAKKEVVHFFSRAFLFHAVYNLLLLPFMWSIEGAMYASLFVATLYTVGLFWYVLSGLMPEAVPPEMQKKRRRELRKRVREERKKSDPGP
jgi:hypothetical protein